MLNAPIAVLLASLATISWAGEVPYGAEGFRPSLDQPCGWRGDNSGIWSGATPPQSFDIEKGTNVRWKLRMPETSNAQPIIVGDLVITTAELYQLIAVDLATGKIRWQVPVNPLAFVEGSSAEEQEKFLKVTPIFDEMRSVQYAHKMASNRRPPNIDLPKAGWKIMRGVLQRLADVQYPGLSVRVPTEAEIDQETLDTIERSPLNKCFNEPFSWFEKKYGFTMAEIWPEVGGYTLASPISDGTNVYVSFGQGQLGAYEVATGKKIWGRFVKPRLGCNSYTAPIIVDQMLIVQRDGFLRALTPATGKQIWETPHIGPGKGYCMGVGHVLRPDGKTALLATASGQIYRLSDGKLLGDLGVANKGSEWGGFSTVGDGKDMVFMLPGGNGEADMFAFRIVLKGDTIEKQEVWKDRQANRSVTPLYHQGLIYHNNDDKTLIVRDAATGKVLSKVSAATRFASPVMAGDRIAWLNSNSLTMTSIGKDFKILAQSPIREDCEHPECAAKAAGKPLSCTQVTSEVNPCFTGKVMVIRTWAYLYCFTAQ